MFLLENTLNNRLIRKGVPQIVKVFASFSNQYLYYKETEADIIQKKVIASAKLNKQTFVLIIGESLNRNHMSLYSYNRKTNPLLEQREDIYIFNNVVSAYSNTINSVLSMLSDSNIDNSKTEKESITILDIFSSAGFKTFWISNQPPYGIWENKITKLAKKADNYQFVNNSSNSSMEATLTASYDELLFNPFIDALNNKAAKKFIVLHLMGNHTSYKKRYPHQFSIFKGSNKKSKTIAEYDNSVIYNDFIIDSIFNICNSNYQINTSSIMALYISDHGENVYDENEQVGHTYAGILPKSNIEIPFILWLPDNNKNSYTEYLNRPYVTDDLFHSIIDINKIITPYFDSSKSIFNEGFNIYKQRILEDNRNYDSK